MKPVLLFLTCTDTQEAAIITEKLLDLRLVACVKWVSTTSYFIWNGTKESADEVLLIMETVEEKYTAIVECVEQLHSYETFVSQAVPVTQTSEAVQKWLKTELGM